MKVCELALALDWTSVSTPDDQREACGVYIGDLLSWVMAHGKAGMAWITVQTHMNVIAVASLMEMSAVIIPEDIQNLPGSGFFIFVYLFESSFQCFLRFLNQVFDIFHAFLLTAGCF